MRPNFKKLARNYEDTGIKALRALVSKQSVYDETTVSKDAPYGLGVKSALDYVAELGEEYGFSVDKCQGRCTEISFGEGGPLIGIYAHADVVPVSGKWDHKPFGAEIVGQGKDAIMFGRGTSDDKGPLIASLMAIKLLKDNGLIKGYRVRLVAGGDEERGSSCLAHYFDVQKKPHCDYGFTPDADFPLIYAEKGICHAEMKGKIDLSPIVAIDGGVVSNAVCDKVVMTMTPVKGLEGKLKSIPGLKYDISDYGAIVIVTIFGKSSHGSVPENGDNAAIKAFKIFGELLENKALLNLANVLADPFGKNFGGECYSKNFGPAGNSTYNYGLVKYKDGQLSMSIDYRFGEAAKPEETMDKLAKATGLTVDVHGIMPILYFDVESPLVHTLMKSYYHMTHAKKDKPMAIGGGTYAKEAKNCVAYGSAFKGRGGDIHSPNEYIYIDDFNAQIAIYADAIYSLGHIKK